MLSEAERRLLARVSVFAGAFTLEAAKAICAGEGIKADAVPNLMNGLIERSLVLVETRGNETCYRLHDTLLRESRDRLLASPQTTELRGRYRDWYLGLAERAEAELGGPDRIAWLDRLESEHDNLRAALEWSLGSGEPELALRLAGALWRFWFSRGHVDEGRAWLGRALSGSGRAPASTRAKALQGAARLAWRDCDYDWAIALMEEAVELARERGDKRSLASSLNFLGGIRHLQGDYGRAAGVCTESLGLSQELGEKSGIALSLYFLGQVAWRQGDFGRAKASLEASLTLREDIGEKRGIALDWHYLALVARSQGDYERAIALHEQALAVFRELSDKGSIAISQNSLALIARSQGDYERASALHGEALALFREEGDKGGIALGLNGLGLVALHLGDYKKAAELCKESLTLRRKFGDRLGIAECLEALASTAVAHGQPVHAATLLGAAQALREALGAPLHPFQRRDYDRDLALVRTRLGEEALAGSWEQGRAIGLEQAIAYALASP